MSVGVLTLLAWDMAPQAPEKPSLLDITRSGAI